MVGSESNSTLGAGIVKQDVVDSKNSRAHEAQPDQNTTYHQGGESSVIRKHQPVNLLRHFAGAHTEVTSAYPINQYVRKSRYPVLNQLSSGNSEGFGIKVRRTKIKIFNTPIDSVSLGLSVGTRFSFGHRYRVGASPVITSYARLRWFLTNDDGDFELGRRYHENDENYQDDSPVGVEMGFFQPKASYLNQNDILYRTEQPANLIFEGAPEDARLAYDIAGAWGLELGLTDRSRILKWLSIDTRIGLSYHNYKQTIQQVTGSTQLALEGAPNLVNRFGFYWGVAPECRIARKLRFHVGYHGLIGSKPKKKFFPGANNGLEGIEVGLNYGF